MILPIVGYGDPVLRKVCEDINENTEELQTLITNMFETMENAYGVGLAAPQVGVTLRLFVVDCSPFGEDEDLPEEERKYLSTFRKVFINAKITNEEGEEWAFNEGCLSIPGVREDEYRKANITNEYLDENFEKHKDVNSAHTARVNKHEYDNTEDVIFTDKLSSLKKKLNEIRLQNIMDKKVHPHYKMKVEKKKE